MKSITLTITEDVYNDLKKIFANEPDFKPMTHEDYVIVNVLKSVIDSYETIDVPTVAEEQ